MKYEYIHELADQEGDERAYYDPEPLAKNEAERGIVIADLELEIFTKKRIGDAIQMRCGPKVGGCQADADEEYDEGVGDEACGEQREEPNALFTEVLVDNVGHYEYDGPEEDAGGEVEGQIVESE